MQSYRTDRYPLAYGDETDGAAGWRPLLAASDGNAALDESPPHDRDTDALLSIAYDSSGADGQGGPASSTGATTSGITTINGLLAGSKWVGPAIVYTDPGQASDYQSGYFTDRDGDSVSAQNDGFARISAAQLAAVRFALNGSNADGGTSPGLGFSVAGFTELDLFYGGSNGTGTIRVANTSDNTTGYAYYPSDSNLGGDAWLGSAMQNPVQGNYSWNNTLHELGHALGLKHGQEAGGPANIGLPANVDSLEFTLMTYRSYVGASTNNYSNRQFSYPQTYMMLDIQALQYLYGADFTTNAGDTVYRWSPTAGQTLIDGVAATNPGGNKVFLTIWDGGGVDTYDLSAYTTSLAIDLTPGGWSTFSFDQLAELSASVRARGNVANALQYGGDARSLIENAIGGSGNDTITGNDANNVLTGGGGNDVLVGGVGDDSLIGGAGVDTASYADATGGVTVSLATTAAQDTIGAGIDTLSSIEVVIGSDFADRLTSGTVPGTFIAARGAASSIATALSVDRIFAGEGSATPHAVVTATGTDGQYFKFTVDQAGDVSFNVRGAAFDGVISLYSANGAFITSSGFTPNAHYALTSPLNPGVYYVAFTGNGATLPDTTYTLDIGVPFHELNQMTLSGGGGDDVLLGAAGKDFLNGDAGQDWLIAGTGSATASGGDGHDSVWGGDGNDLLTGGPGDDTITGGAGIDTVTYAAAGSRVEIDLSWIEDQDTRGAGVDTLLDIENVVGSAFDDRLAGNRLANVLTGGAGADTFVFKTDLGGGNIDTIADFVTGVDHIELAATIFAAIAPGALAAAAFVTGTAAADLADRIIYNSTTGALFYDADGTGSQAAVQFAILQGNPALAASDFVIV